MENVILVVHILTCIAMIGVVLLQRSEGGALGMGGGGGGGLVSGRGAASVLTRTTMILAAVFFVTSLVLTTMATRGAQSALGLGEEIEAQESNELDDPLNFDAPVVPEAGAPSSALDELINTDDLDAVLPPSEETTENPE